MAFRHLDQKYLPWSFLGYLVGIVGLLFGLYAYFHEKRPSLAFEVLNDANVLDVRAAVAGLRISFRDADIAQSNQNLRVISVRVLNTGEADLRPTDFDENVPWGLHVRDGTVVSAHLVTASSAYLSERLAPTLVGDDVRFSRPILEKGAQFTLELIVLHPKDRLPQLVPIGKIVGSDDFSLVVRSADRNQQGLFATAVQGGWLPNVIRFVLSLLALVSFVMLIIAMLEGTQRLGRWRVTSRRRARIAGFASDGPDDAVAMAIRIYLDHGRNTLEELLEREPDQRFVNLVRQGEEQNVMHVHQGPVWTLTGGGKSGWSILDDSDYLKALQELHTAGFLVFSKDRPARLSATFRSAAQALLNYVKRHDD